MQELKKNALPLNPQSSDDKAEDLFKKAWDLMNRHSYEAAVRLFTQAAEQNYPPAYVMLHNLYSLDGLTIYNKAAADQWIKLTAEEKNVAWIKAEAKKQYPEILYTYGVMLQFGIGVPQELSLAKEYFKNALEKMHDKEILFNLGGVSLKQQCYEEARDYYNQALEIDPLFFKARHNLAIVFCTLNKEELAIPHFQKITESYPTHALAWLNWVQALISKNRKIEAKRTSENALHQIEKNNLTTSPIYWQLKATFHELRKEWMLGILSLDCLLILNPKSRDETVKFRARLIRKMEQSENENLIKKKLLYASENNIPHVAEICNLTGFKIDRREMAALSEHLEDKCCKITQLELDGHCLNEETGSVLATSLRKNNSLKELVYHGAISATLMQSKIFNYLNFYPIINRDQITEKEIQRLNFELLEPDEINEFFSKHNKLTHLDFSNRKINQNSKLLQPKVYPILPQVTILDFSNNLIDDPIGNHQGKNNAVTRLLNLLSYEHSIFPKLQTLDLRNNQITSYGFRCLIDRLQSKRLPSGLRSIVLDNNHIEVDEETLSEYVESLQHLAPCLTISVSGNMMSEIKDESLLNVSQALNNSEVGTLAKRTGAFSQDSNQLKYPSGAWGFVRQAVSFPSENPFYIGISEQLRYQLKIFISPEKIWNLTKIHLLSNKQLYVAYNEAEMEDGLFIQKITRQEKWLKKIRNVALARTFNMNLVVISNKGGDLRILRCAEPLATLCLEYATDGSYYSLETLDSSNKNKIAIEQGLNESPINCLFASKITLEELKNLSIQEPLEIKREIKHSRSKLSFFYSRPTSVKSIVSPETNHMITPEVWRVFLAYVKNLFKFELHAFILLEGMTCSGQHFIERQHIFRDTEMRKNTAVIEIAPLEAAYIISIRSQMHINLSKPISRLMGEVLQKTVREKKQEVSFSQLGSARGEYVNCSQWCIDLLKEVGVLAPDTPRYINPTSMVLS